MQSNCEQSPVFIAAFVAMQIKLLGFIPEIVVALRLRKHKECKALFKSGRGNLAFEDLVYSAAKFLLQLRRRFEPCVNSFIYRP